LNVLQHTPFTRDNDSNHRRPIIDSQRIVLS